MSDFTITVFIEETGRRHVEQLAMEVGALLLAGGHVGSVQIYDDDPIYPHVQPL